MTKGLRSKSVGTILLLAGLLAAFLVAGFVLSGCSSKKEGTQEGQAEGTLPQDIGNKSLLDTTAVAQQTQPPATTPPVAQKPAPKPKPKPPTEYAAKPAEPKVVKTLLLPEGTAMTVSLLTTVSTGENKIGDQVRATVKGPATQGETLNLPDGTILEGKIADLNDGKAEGQKAYIKLEFTNLIMPGEQGVPIEGWIVTKDGSGTIRPGDQGTSIARDAAIGAAAGGILGAVTGGKTKDAAKGAVAGAAAGGVLGAVLHKDQVTLKEGRTMDVKLAAPAYQEKVQKGI